MPVRRVTTLFALLGIGAASAMLGVPPRSFVCASSFSTPSELSALPWPAISDLVQGISSISISSNGSVSLAEPQTWPLASLRDAAHSSGSRIWVAVHVVSKPAATTFFGPDTPAAALTASAQALAALVASAKYDGFSLDIEGLQAESKSGYEAFVSAAAAAAHANSLEMHTTLYAPKLLETGPSAYDVKFLATTAGVFIMGYDMSWYGGTPGLGWQQAGPNAPIDALGAALDNAASRGAPAAQLILGLPWYGRVFACDGTKPAAHGNCSCTTKNFKKKSLDTIQPLASQPGCTEQCAEITAGRVDMVSARLAYDGGHLSAQVR
jgi:hypothetical protein